MKQVDILTKEPDRKTIKRHEICGETSGWKIHCHVAKIRSVYREFPSKSKRHPCLIRYKTI